MSASNLHQWAWRRVPVAGGHLSLPPQLKNSQSNQKLRQSLNYRKKMRRPTRLTPCKANGSGLRLREEECSSALNYTKNEDRRITIQGDQITMARNRGERQKYIGKYEIDSSNGHFDFVGTGPDQAPNHWTGIDELHADELKLCDRKKATEDAVRPTEFKPDDDQMNLGMFVTFKRVNNR